MTLCQKRCLQNSPMMSHHYQDNIDYEDKHGCHLLRYIIIAQH